MNAGAIPLLPGLSPQYTDAALASKRSTTPEGLLLRQDGLARIATQVYHFSDPPLSTSRLPSFSQHPESIGKHGELGEHGSEALDQVRQPRLRHIGDQIVEHAALPKQRVSTSLGGV